MLGTDEVDGARWEMKLPNQIVKAGIKQQMTTIDEGLPLDEVRLEDTSGSVDLSS